MIFPLLIPRLRNETLVLSLPLWYRAVFLLMAGVLVFGFVVVRSREPNAPWTWNDLLPALFVLLSLVGSLYEERWTIGRTEIVYRLGLIFAHQTRRFEASSAAGVELRSFIKGQAPGAAEPVMFWRRRFFQPRMVQLNIVLSDGERLAIDLRRESAKPRLAAMARMIAERLDVGVTETS